MKEKIDQNCIFDGIPTRFSSAVQLINNGYCDYSDKGYCTENWHYPFISYGEPTSRFYGEIWVSGMDWTKDFWLVYSKNWERPKVDLLFSFSDNCRVINDYDLWRILIDFLSNFSGFNPSQDDGCDSHCPIEPLAITKANGFILATYGHASQKEVSFDINPIFLPYFYIQHDKTGKFKRID